MKESDIRPQDLFNEYLALAKRDSEIFFADRASFAEVDCPACGASARKPALEKYGFTYVTCAECDSLYQSPRPTPALFDAYYREAESVRFWSTRFYKDTEEARRVRIFRPRAELVGSLVADAAAPGTFVDIGSGYGIFLEEIARLGRFDRVVGLEPNPELAEVCRGKGFTVVQKTAEASDANDLQANFATSFEVLEHVFSPVEFLTAIRNLLAPGGQVLCTTLTADGFDIRVLWERSKSVHPPHHINLMSVEGMRRLFARAGLEVTDISTPGQLDVDIVANMLTEDPSIEVPRFVSKLLASGDATRQAFQQFLAGNRLSSHIRVVARRN